MNPSFFPAKKSINQVFRCKKKFRFEEMKRRSRPWTYNSRNTFDVCFSPNNRAPTNQVLQDTDQKISGEKC